MCPIVADVLHSLGSVLNHVLLHQRVIGLEAMEQMEMAGDDADVIIGCDGGGVLGHPTVYLKIGDAGEVICPYCSRHFVLTDDAPAAAGH